MDQTTVKKELRELITKYERALSTGALKKYTEEETKKDFILPLFEILGWNVYDKNEVSAEEHIRSSGRVDYGFYLHERPRFYLEAKPFKADLHREEYARQAIQYAWNRGVTWAVLTDFESIKVFNTQDISQYLANKLFFEIPYREYLPRFDQLWLLSKEAFGVDLIDKEAERVGKKLQRVSVGTLLYKDLNECRTILTKELATWNEKVPRGLLDEGVQKLLDRIIFLRVAEDRGIEPPTLLPLIREWKSSKTKRHLYQSMVEKFRELDGIYNSNLFLPHPLEKWEEYSDATEKVVSILYGKRGYYEYDFKAIPADILGSVYENYLGYRLSQSKKGVTLDKDSRKRKEHGIYYTPAFIVDYIVKNTLKPVLDQCRGIGDVKKIKVLDPACGSGSFLLKALEVINDKYKSFGKRGNAWTKLTILSENLYGVDLDEQAVEIARLNLLINALDERIKFPLLSNIKNGNSLISGTDSELKKYFGAKFREKKPFKWEEEYPAVFKTGGFDVVIGNPPYIFARGGSFNDKEKSYYYDRFKLQQYQINTYLLFIERAYNLLKEGGVLGFIVPNNWLTISSFSKLREFVLKNVGELRIINAVDSVFSQASVDTCLLLFRKMSPTKVQLGELRSGAVPSPTIHEPKEFYLNNFIINISKLRSSLGNSLTEKLNRLPRLGAVAVVSTGLKAYQIGKGKPPQR